jgi:hypothetical protein
MVALGFRFRDFRIWSLETCGDIRLESGMRTEMDIAKRQPNGLFKGVKLNRGPMAPASQDA